MVLVTLLLLAFATTLQAASRGEKRNKDVGDSIFSQRGHRALTMKSDKKGKGGCTVLAASQLCGVTFDGADTPEIVLGENIDCGESSGPTLTNGAELNCNGNTISGSSGFEGVTTPSSNTVGVTIKNCKISGFDICIDLIEESDIDLLTKIENVQITDCDFEGLSVVQAGSGDHKVELKKFTAVGNGSGITQSAGQFSKMEDVTLCSNSKDIDAAQSDTVDDADVAAISASNVIFTSVDSFADAYLAIQDGTCEDESDICPLP